MQDLINNRRSAKGPLARIKAPHPMSEPHYRTESGSDRMPYANYAMFMGLDFACGIRSLPLSVL
jgi:hypothetical protein